MCSHDARRRRCAARSGGSLKPRTVPELPAGQLENEQQSSLEHLLLAEQRDQRKPVLDASIGREGSGGAACDEPHRLVERGGGRRVRELHAQGARWCCSREVCSHAASRAADWRWRAVRAPCCVPRVDVQPELPWYKVLAASAATRDVHVDGARQGPVERPARQCTLTPRSSRQHRQRPHLAAQPWICIRRRTMPIVVSVLAARFLLASHNSTLTLSSRSWRSAAARRAARVVGIAADAPNGGRRVRTSAC